jgi:N6-adenosine-specific RNA methylase IME4
MPAPRPDDAELEAMRDERLQSKSDLLRALVSRTPRNHTLERRPLPLPVGPFDLVYLDPPWRWLTRSPKGDGKAPPYRCMSLAELRALPITSLLAKDAMAVIWVIDTHLWLAKELCESWGFHYSSVAFYWAKTTKHGKWHVGTGKTTRANPEQCWLLRWGKGLPIRDHGVRRLIVSPVREHSRKPDEARRGLERLFGPCRRVELFARQRAPGWTSHGDELPPLEATA